AAHPPAASGCRRARGLPARRGHVAGARPDAQGVRMGSGARATGVNALPLHEGLRRVVDTLLASGIRYMVCGSLASSRHGEPRSTYDFDVVADVAHEHAGLLTRALSEDFYVDEQLIADAVRSRSAFNLVHLASGMK